ncbi:MAG: hypothetical protein ACI9U2_001302, partial [Bradymonadia bacterium]
PGTIIRARGDITILGTIAVAPAARPSAIRPDSGAGVTPPTRTLPGGGLLNPKTAGVIGVLASAGFSKGASAGGRGGGAVALIAGGTLVVDGRIVAPGGAGQAAENAAGSGGGGGGFIWLGARIALNLTGTLTATGGDGADARGDLRQGGGGGSGGLVHLVGPGADAAAPTVELDGGAAGESVGVDVVGGPGGGLSARGGAPGQPGEAGSVIRTSTNAPGVYLN